MQLYIDLDTFSNHELHYTLTNLKIRVDDAAWATVKSALGGGGGGLGGGGGGSATPSTNILSYQQLIVNDIKSSNIKVGVSDGDIVTVDAEPKKLNLVKKFKRNMDDVLDFFEREYKKEEAEFSTSYAYQKGQIDDFSGKYSNKEKDVFLYIVDYIEKLRINNKIKHPAMEDALDNLYAGNGRSDADDHDAITGVMALFLSEVLAAEKKKSKKKKLLLSQRKLHQQLLLV